MLDNIADVIELLHPSILNFIRDLNDEDLLKLREAAREVYEAIQSNSGTVRSLRLYKAPTPSVAKTREERNLKGFQKLFAEYNNLVHLTDKQMAETVQDELWAFQSIYSRESAMIEAIVDRLSRSSAGALKPMSSNDLDDLVKSLA